MTTERKQEKVKVLFVDDEEGILRSLKRLFMDEDFETLTATSGKEGLDLLKGDEIAVIVSDQKMPGMSGAEFLEKAREVLPDTIRMVLTGYADIHAAMDAINKGGAYRYTTKPWNDDELTLAVREAVDKYRLIKENKYLTELTARQNEELKKWSTELEFYVQQQTVDLTRQNKELKKLNEKLNKNMRDVISSFSNLIELRDKTILSHSNNVAFISGKLAQKAGLNERETEVIVTAAQLHDIGKIGIADAVMLKSSGGMSPEELSEYQKHPVRGQISIDSIEDLREAGVLIRHHHEWLNGKGFPDGLRGDKIPTGSRIIALADKFDRLIHGIFEVHPVQTVLSKLRTLAGTQFDPELFAFLVEVVRGELTSDPSAPNSLMIDLAGSRETVLSIDGLSPGMIISKDIKSGTGIMLLSKGTVLDEKKIAILQRYFRIDPSQEDISVWVRKRQSQQ